MSVRHVTVKVQERHIREGLPRRPGSCPIALALRESGHPDAEVSTCDWDSESAHGLLSKRAQTFVDRFDQGQPVKPATFRLPFTGIGL